MFFEETNDVLAGKRSDDVTKWVWGGVDLCCAPLNGANDGQVEKRGLDEVSTVRLLLQEDEYREALKSLQEETKLFYSIHSFPYQL